MTIRRIPRGGNASLISYLAPGGPGPLTATAQLRKHGKRITLVEAEVEQDGDVIALASGTFTTVG